MLNILKKVSPASYLFAGGAVISLIAMIIAAVSCSGEGFGMKQLPLVIVLSVAAVILGVAIVFVSGKFGDGILSTVLVVAMTLVTVFCVYAMIMGKSDVFGTVLFSDLEKGYAPAERACNLGIASIIVYLIAAVVTAAGGFFKLAKADK